MFAFFTFVIFILVCFYDDVTNVSDLECDEQADITNLMDTIKGNFCLNIAYLYI